MNNKEPRKGKAIARKESNIVSETQSIACFCCQFKGWNMEDNDIPDWTTSLGFFQNTENDCISCRHVNPRLRSFQTPPSLTVPTTKRVKLGSAMVTIKGYISIQFTPSLKVDFTPSGALRVVDKQNGTMIAVNASGEVSALLHACGQVFQQEEVVDIEVYASRNHKHAKMNSQGIRFTSEKCALTFLTDIAGTKSTTDTFMNLRSEDYTKVVIMTDPKFGKCSNEKGMSIIKNACNWVEDKTEYWDFYNSLKICKDEDGAIRVIKNAIEVKVSSNGKGAITTPFVRMTASSNGSVKHMFIRIKDSRMHFDGNKFVVRYRSQSAGFDEKDEIKVF